MGDMLELGKHTTEAHTNIGKVAKDNADVLVVVGPRAKSIKEGAMEVDPATGGAGMNPENIFEFPDSRQTGDFLKTFIRAGDIILIKGSQGMRMERAVEAVLSDQANKKKLLVRQDAEWLKKE